MLSPRGVYAGARARISDLARGASEGELALTVPACPDWTVKDLLAHCVGIASDTAAGNLERMGAPAWTHAQASSRAAPTVSELLGEGGEKAAALEPMLAES